MGKVQILEGKNGHYNMEEKSLDGDAWMSSRKLDCEWKWEPSCKEVVLQGCCKIMCRVKP